MVQAVGARHTLAVLLDDGGAVHGGAVGAEPGSTVQRAKGDRRSVAGDGSGHGVVGCWARRAGRGGGCKLVMLRGRDAESSVFQLQDDDNSRRAVRGPKQCCVVGFDAAPNPSRRPSLQVGCIAPTP